MFIPFLIALNTHQKPYETWQILIVFGVSVVVLLIFYRLLRGKKSDSEENK